MVYMGYEIDEQVLEFAVFIRKHDNLRTDVLPVFTDG